MLSLAGGIEHIEARPQRALGAPPRSRSVDAPKLEEKQPMDRYEQFCTDWFMPSEQGGEVPDPPGAT